jgi:hypothetical protein
MSLTSSLRKRARSLSRGIRRTFGHEVSDDEDEQLRRKRQTRAASPPPPTPEELQRQYDERNVELARIQAEQEEMNQASMREEANQFKHNEEVNEIITSLNEYLSSFFGEGVNVDNEAPNIRYFVGMIVTSRNVGQSVAQRLARSKPLLRAVANFIVNRATAGARGLHNQVTRLLPIIRNGLVNVGNFLLRVGMTTGTAAYDAISIAASNTRDYFTREPEPVYGRAASPPPGMQSMREMASHAFESITTGLHLFYRALYNVLRRVSSLLLQCGSSVASVAAAGAMRVYGAVCPYFTPQKAVDKAVNQIVEQDYECSICMTDAKGPDAVLTNCNHRFHASCITPWLTRNRTCPNCRQLAIPTRYAQAGGGLKKYRPKSKTRRLRKSRSKPRKSHKSRKPRSSSRRK